MTLDVPAQPSRNRLVLAVSIALASALHAGALWWLIASGVIEGAGGRFGQAAIPTVIEVEIVEAAPSKEMEGGQAEQIQEVEGEKSQQSIAQAAARAWREAQPEMPLPVPLPDLMEKPPEP